MEQRFSVYHEDEDLLVRLEEAGGYIFLHLEVKQGWNKETLKLLRSGIDNLFEELKGKGHEWAFATSDNEKTVKFWNLVKTCETVKKFGPRQEYWMGAWYFGDD